MSKQNTKAKIIPYNRKVLIYHEHLFQGILERNSNKNHMTLPKITQVDLLNQIETWTEMATSYGHMDFDKDQKSAMNQRIFNIWYCSI